MTPFTPPFQSDFTPEVFRVRHGRLLAAMGPGAHLLLQGAGPCRGYELFTQTNAFYYCCGVEAPGAYLLLSPDGRVSLYLPARGKARTTREQPLTLEDAEVALAVTCVDAVHGVDELDGHLAGAAAIYTPHAPAEQALSARDILVRANRHAIDDPWDGLAAREDRFRDRLRSRHPAAALHDLSPILDQLRGVKDETELALMRRAGTLSATAVTRAMQMTRPGMLEGELHGSAQGLYQAGGARGEGYRAIVPSGANIWDAHYMRNSDPLRDGDLVLMDTAPDVGYYTSDIGRMWPVNGTYQPWQRELYSYIVDYHKVLLGLIRPGRTAEEIHAEAAARMRAVIDRTTFSKTIYREAAERTLDFKGHLSHPVGMAVHDVGSYRDRKLWPGLVFAVDPQIWVPEEQLYVRVEDTVAVTETGIEVLTADAPLDWEEVEATVGTAQETPAQRAHES